MAGISRQFDVTRIAAALRSPGIDPRTWVSLAVVTEVQLDEQNGLICAVTLMPSRVPDYAQVSSCYQGPGWGLHMPVHVDDIVIVVAPSGVPDEGMIILGVVPNPSQAPSSVAVAHALDFVLVVEPGQSMLVQTADGGAIEYTASGEIQLHSDDRIVLDSGTVLLGSSLAIEQLMLGTTYRAADSAFDTSLGAANTTAATAMTTLASALTTASTALGTPPTAGMPVLGGTLALILTSIATGITALAANSTATATAASTKEAGAPGYLSNVSKTT